MKRSLVLQIVSWSLRLIAAYILLQTLFFKFTAAPESVYIFSRLGVEPWGRIGAGVAELITSLLLLYPRTVIYGAIGAVMIMVGALAAHLTVLGVSVEGDGGYLFGLALVVLICGLVLIGLHRRSLPLIGAHFAPSIPAH